MLPITSPWHTLQDKQPILYALAISVLGSLFLYLAYFKIDLPLLTTLSGLIWLYLLLPATPKVWFWSGFFIGLFWFWWIALSFIHYQMPWAIPLVIVAIGLIYGGLFWLIAKMACDTAQFIPNKSVASQRTLTLFTLTLKALGLLVLSYIHPFGFDWFKPELIFVNTFLGIEKWHFALILATLTLLHHFRKPWLGLLLLPAISLQHPYFTTTPPPGIALVTTHITVEEKWNEAKQATIFQSLLKKIDKAIEANSTMVILPESVFPRFLNHEPKLFESLKKRAANINIVTGALYWDGKTPHNSTYIFTTDGSVTVANKVVLVPFGEANPLPDFLSDWVNRIFYDGAVDYQPSPHIADYTIGHTTYRNAICFEATSERLYQGKPQQMIVLSNNGWFVPSIEPTLQRLLLTYYSRKYGTTILHAVNMSNGYVIYGKSGKKI